MGGEINTTFGNVFSLGDFTVAANTHVSGEYTLATNYDGTTSNLYVNGYLIIQTTPSPAISAGVKEFILGKEFDGYVKNFKFWNYAKHFYPIVTISFRYCPGGRTSTVTGDSNQVECYVYSETTSSFTSETPFLTWGPQNDNSWNEYSGTFTPPSAGDYRLVWKLTTGNHVPDTGWDDITFGNTTWDFETGNDGFKYHKANTLNISNASDWGTNGFGRTDGSTVNGSYILISQQSPQSYYIWYDGSYDDNNDNVQYFIISPTVSM